MTANELWRLEILGDVLDNQSFLGHKQFMPYLNRVLQACWAAACLLLASQSMAAPPHARANELAKQLDARLEKLESDPASRVAGDVLATGGQVIVFYDERGGQPLWVDPNGLSKPGQELWTIIQAVEYEGLLPAHFHLPNLNAIFKKIETDSAAALAEALAVRAAREREIAAELAALEAARKAALQELKEREEAARNAAQDDDDAADDDDDDAADDDDDAADDDDDEAVDDDDDEAATDDDDEQDDDSQALGRDQADKLTTEASATDISQLPPLVAPPPQASLLADIELLLADAYLLLARQRAFGVVNPTSLDIGWHLPMRGNKALGGQRQAAESGRLREYLQGLKPPAAEYLALEVALQRYSAIAARGGWPQLSAGSMLKLGEGDSKRVPLLRKRLASTGDLDTALASNSDGEFDMALHRAVKDFQARHGLQADGVVGPKTLYMLNVPVSERIAALRVNLERWRWLPEELGRTHIRVNVPAFHMAVYENNKPVLDMPVIVGMPDRRTPNFSETMKYLVANPTWEVPSSIAKKDKLPILRENLAYLTEHGFDVLSGWGEKETKVDAASLDWSEFNDEYFPYRLRQNPGPTNALGRIKFMLPNRYNIYLHDTPGKHLFSAQTRTFSSGCIRLQRPLELADYVLGNDPRWQGKDIREILEGEPKQILRLKNHIPVHILYFTAWVDEQGVVNFREDVYNRDGVVIDAMRQNLVAAQ